jgi:hypothetical protein
VPIPPAPATVDATGLNEETISQLLLKTLYFGGELTGAVLARRLGLSFRVIESSLEFLTTQRSCEIAGGAMLGRGSFRYRITEAGRSTAVMFLQQNQYVGVAPVPLTQYQAYMKAFGETHQLQVTERQVREAFAHLVLSDAVLDEIGPAINGNHSIFIYGPPGNGKTAMARGIQRLLSGEIAIPFAIEVEGQIIRVFDPVTHERVPTQKSVLGDFEVDASADARWMLCRRPAVVTGGELTLDSLELSFDARHGFYRAPMHLLANGGLLIIDDFGRQHCSPGDLLNRWMVPLENRVDYLTLRSGLKFEVPFQVLVAFATNIKPADLVDEAFLRRVQYKVFAENPDRESFIRIFELCCLERGIPFARALVEQVLDGYYVSRQVPLRACQPRDLVNHAMLLATYRGLPKLLTSELLDSACHSYFVEDGPG